jgi:hypothetical protein
VAPSWFINAILTNGYQTKQLVKVNKSFPFIAPALARFVQRLSQESCKARHMSRLATVETDKWETDSDASQWHNTVV